MPQVSQLLRDLGSFGNSGRKTSFTVDAAVSVQAVEKAPKPEVVQNFRLGRSENFELNPISTFLPASLCFFLFSSVGSSSLGGIAGPVPVLGRVPQTALSRLPKVKSRGHVYPLSYLPYFEDSTAPTLSPVGSQWSEIAWQRLTADFNSDFCPSARSTKKRWRPAMA